MTRLTTDLFTVYGLLDPASRALRYVGQTVRTPRARLLGHLWTARHESRRSPVTAWVGSILRRGLEPELVVLEECADRASLNDAEVFWIAYCRFVGCDLKNLCIGGETRRGTFRQSEEFKQKLRERNSLHPLSAESLRRRTETRRKNGWSTLEGEARRIASVKAARTGVPRTLEVRQKISQSHMGIRPSEETREKMRAASKRRWERACPV
jgi:hypothetical protein